MRPPQHSWTNTAGSQGVLMFSQLMREMLTDQSFESFRAFSLDTIARLDEAIIVANDVRQNRIPAQALEPVQAELGWSLMKDPMAKDVAGAEIDSFVGLMKGDKIKTEDIVHHVLLLRRRLGENYKAMCENKILALYAEDNKRIQLRHATGFYCSYLLNKGYSRTFLVRCIEDTFFARPLHRVGKRTLIKFFRNFDEIHKKFFVFSIVDNNFSGYLKKLNFDIYSSAARLPNNFRNLVTDELPITGSQSYVLSEEHAFDGDGAVAQVEKVLTAVRALAFIVPYDMGFRWNQDMYVVKSRSTLGAILQGQALPLQRAVISSGAARRELKAIKSYSGKVLTHFDRSSTRRILNSLNTSALARTSSSIENQLISMWSAVEVLVSDPPRDTARINHYTKLLLPCICLRYIRRQTVAVYNEMLVSYRKKFTSIIRAETTIGNTDQHTKFAAILFLPNNAALRDQLVEICVNNPLARHRLWKLVRDYSTPKDIKATLDAHEQRVNWQMRRIYRGRNNLVHTGRAPSYLDSLVINLDEYYRASLGTLVNRASRDGDESDIDQLIAEIGIEYKIYLRYFDSKKMQTTLSNEAFLRAIL